MNTPITPLDLEKRWQAMLSASAAAVNRHPRVYRELQALVRQVLSGPLDVDAYFPTAETLVDLLSSLDPQGAGTIFHAFKERMSPSDIWHVRLLRVECMDLLDYLETLNEWRRTSHGLRVLEPPQSSSMSRASAR
ncbi:MAG: hypothetical protein V1793_19440 [Pseudomonadota bacterium]